MCRQTDTTAGSLLNVALRLLAGTQRQRHTLQHVQQSDSTAQQQATPVRIVA
jgi:hypothetical protein